MLKLNGYLLGMAVSVLGFSAPILLLLFLSYYTVEYPASLGDQAGKGWLDGVVEVRDGQAPLTPPVRPAETAGKIPDLLPSPAKPATPGRFTPPSTPPLTVKATAIKSADKTPTVTQPARSETPARKPDLDLDSLQFPSFDEELALPPKK